MNKLTYDNKPEKIESISDLMEFIDGIPNEQWMVDKRSDNFAAPQKCCVLGHLDRAYLGCYNLFKIGICDFRIAAVNNGAQDYENCDPGGIHNRPPGTGTDGASIKNRLLNYLSKKLTQVRKSA